MYQDTQHPAPQAPQTVLPEFCRVSYIANPRSWGFAARTQLDSGRRRICMYCSHMQDIIWIDLMLLPSMSHRSDRSVVGRAGAAVHIQTLWVAIAVEDHVLCTNQKPIFTRRVWSVVSAASLRGVIACLGRCKTLTTLWLGNWACRCPCPSFC